MDSTQTGSIALIVLIYCGLGILSAIPIVIWYAIKIWFIAKIARKGWGD